MPATVDKKRKKSGTDNKVSPAKKRKLEPKTKPKPKSTPKKALKIKPKTAPAKSKKAAPAKAKKATPVKAKKVTPAKAKKATPVKAKKATQAKAKKATPAKAKKAIPAKAKKATPVKAKKTIPVKAKKANPATKVKKITPKGNKSNKTDSKTKKPKPVVKKSIKVTGNKKISTQVAKNLKSKAVKKLTAKSTTKVKPVSKKNVKPAKKITDKQKPKVSNNLKSPPKKMDKSIRASLAKPQKAVVKLVVKAKLEKAKATKAKVTVAKAKLKAAKTLTRNKQQQKIKPAVQEKSTIKTKPVQKQDEKKSAKEATQPKRVEKKIPEKISKSAAQETTPKSASKQKLTEIKKRKNIAEEDISESPRKRRVITPNKKYADFETDTSQKRISELRAYLQDKKNTPSTVRQTDTPTKSEKQNKVTKAETTPVKKATAVKKASKLGAPKQSPEIKVIKTSEMKPAEKLLKKLQKKLEREAKAAFVKPKQSPHKDTAKTKITKVVTYNKPAFSKVTNKSLLLKEKVKQAKQVVAAKKTPIEKTSSEKVIKVTPKSVQSQEKPKPKKIKELKKEERKIQTKFLFQKNVRQPDDDSQTCWITGIDIFKSGEVILIDMSNKKIKLFTSAFEFISMARLDTTPQDISISPIDASVAYFTKPFAKEGIQKICMADGALTLKESFCSNGTNRGIKCIKSGILTSVQNGRYHDLDINCFKIDLLDYKGNVLQSVSTDLTGARLFKLPLYFTVNSTGKQIIVSDCIRNNAYILSLDMSGRIKFKFTGVRDTLITPRGLTVDDDDNIYVTEWERHNVYVLTPAGKRLQLLLDHREQLLEGQDGLLKPYQLCHYKHEGVGRLIVSQESCNAIKVFQISQKQPGENGTANTTPVSSEVTKPATDIAETNGKAATTDTNKKTKPSADKNTAAKPALVAATDILAQEHAYTTLSSAPAEKKNVVVAKENVPEASEPESDNNPEELSSLVDSIISGLDNRGTSIVPVEGETVISDQGLAQVAE